MKKSLLVLALFIISIFAYTQEKESRYDIKNFSVILQNGNQIYLRQPLSLVKASLKGIDYSKKEILHQDYGRLIWKSSGKFTANPSLDIIEYDLNGLCIQGYRGVNKVHTIIATSKQFQLINDEIQIGKPFPDNFGESFYKQDNMAAFQIGISIDTEATLQVYFDSNHLVNKIVITNKVD